MEMDFVRGDPNYHTCSIPLAAWSAAGRLFFAAKPAIDDDNTDASALIQGDWGDSSTSIVTLTVNGVTGQYVQYACNFPPSATNGILSNGAASADYLGEFEFVPANGLPMTAPGIGDKIPVTLWFDVKRKTTE